MCNNTKLKNYVKEKLDLMTSKMEKSISKIKFDLELKKNELEKLSNAPLLCLRVLVVPPQYDVHPVYALLTVLMTSLTEGSPMCPNTRCVLEW